MDQSYYIACDTKRCQIKNSLCQDGPDVFYKKEELKGKRLHELDQDILHTIAGWYLRYTYILVLLKMVFIMSHYKNFR